jgi:hypothetical protein
MVGGTWIEHVTSSVSRKRSPTELTAHSGGAKFSAAFDMPFVRMVDWPNASPHPTVIRSTMIRNLQPCSTTPQVGGGSMRFGPSDVRTT